jgi:hypothetical protein
LCWYQKCIGQIGVAQAIGPIQESRTSWVTAIEPAPSVAAEVNSQPTAAKPMLNPFWRNPRNPRMQRQHSLSSARI